MTTVSDIVPGTQDFAADWSDWHRRHEAARAGEHGFLATSPLPPAENRLTVAIEAGEKIPAAGL